MVVNPDLESKDPEKRARALLNAMKTYYKPHTFKLSPIDEGKRFKELTEFYKITYIAKEIGRSRALITTRIHLLKLIPELQKMLIKKELGIWEAYEISKMDPIGQAGVLEELKELLKKNE